MTPRPSSRLARSAVVVHRWLGVTVAALFLVWFPSGIGMMYWEFPSVSAADRLNRSPALDGARIRLSPMEAYATLGASRPPAQVRLNTFDGRPVYRFRAGGAATNAETIVYADTGERQSVVPKAMRDRIAFAWTGESAGAARVESLDAVDQWTVDGTFRDYRPLWKYAWPDGQQAYIAQASGEVVQYTTTASRIGAYLGPIPHWLYFTPLRKHQLQWRRLVIWLSAIGTATAILGLSIGISMYSPSKRYRYAGGATAIPYRGPKRWHMALGLIFGLGALTWAFSGLLSMEPFPVRIGDSTASADKKSDAGIAEALRGPIRLAAFAVKPPQAALAELASLDVKELELATCAGSPAYIATLNHGDTRVVPLDGEPRREFDRRRLAGALTMAVQSTGAADVRVLDQYDAYYLDRRHRQPLPVMLLRADDAEHARYYIDPKTARVVGTYRSRDWQTRWLYHGLHSLDVPWLYTHRPAWDIVVMTFMFGGTALASTSLILAWRALRRRLMARVAVRTRLSEDA